MQLFVPVVLVGVALVLFVAPVGEWLAPPSPRTTSVEVPAETRLRPRGDDPTRIDIGGVSLRCVECHGLFESHEVTPDDLRQHTEVALDHGLNDACFNCHDGGDHMGLVMHDGSVVPLAESETLCSQCHGPTFRDWQSGIHGRTDGFWDRRLGEPSRLTCVECHDPHVPAVAGLEPLPAPQGWRIPDADAHHAGPRHSKSPLRRWNGGGAPHGGGGSDG